ncbi:uncharacterized protein EI90DRAFT_2680264 [Cantharellus anzutake]|uniref:uncharacterized protein n=1 Tax=Cantharellus anzutake TaxID=1750568 RepID=UPI001907E185|nr:uncharacterized protein EI90DRAFT_2680264 [Cantharellus anzutake]KAF8319498.1 hypothetical protein EI90DRAFT_2680264 [Cantharellus anzutake]
MTWMHRCFRELIVIPSLQSSPRRTAGAAYLKYATGDVAVCNRTRAVARSQLRIFRWLAPEVDRRARARAKMLHVPKAMYRCAVSPSTEMGTKTQKLFWDGARRPSPLRVQRYLAEVHSEGQTEFDVVIRVARSGRTRYPRIPIMGVSDAMKVHET